MSNGEKRHVVLVVDDEPFVLSSVSAVLEFAGFEVLRAASGADALNLAVRHSAPIDLLLTDVRLPGPSGPLIAARFARFHPEARCLFMAGLPDHPDLPESVRHDRYGLLPKPFTPKTLLETVRHVLEPLAQSQSA